MVELDDQIRQGLRRLEGADSPLLDDVESRSEVHTAFEALAAKLGAESHIFFPEDANFPPGLPSGGPARVKGLVTLGNSRLFNEVMIGICGSRKATERGLQVSREVCGDLARDGAIIVSGYAAGVDESAHRAALESGGRTICVLAEGINHFRIRKSLKDVWDWDRCLVVSQFGLSAVWQAGRAMIRNKTIVGMSKATLVVEARGTGGTLDAGFTALKMGKPLLVVDYAGSASETAGNKLLISHGGIPLRKSRSTGTPSMAALNRIVGTTH